jgi:hypothetical protein
MIKVKLLTQLEQDMMLSHQMIIIILLGRKLLVKMVLFILVKHQLLLRLNVNLKNLF